MMEFLKTLKIIRITWSGIIMFFISTMLYTAAYAATYYINNQTGSGCSDTGAGTSSSAPWCTFTPVNNISNGTGIPAGTHILLARGATWNQELKLVGNGTSGSWNVLDAYGTGANPQILRNNNEADRGIRLINPSYWQLSNLEVGNAGTGILVYFDTKFHQGLLFSNLYLHGNAGIDRENTTSSLADHIYFSAGLEFTGHFASMGSTEYAVKDITISNVEGTDNNNSIDFGWEGGSAPTTWPAPQTTQNIHINNVYLHDDDGAGRATSCSQSLDLIDVTNVKVVSSNLDNEASCFASQGTAAVFFGLAANVDFMNSMITNVPNTDTYDQTGFDYEVATDQVNIRNSYIAGNAGAGIEILNIHPSSYYTNSTISGNVFASNNSSDSSGVGGGSVVVNGTSSSTPTGTFRDNLYYEPGKSFSLPVSNASLAGFTQTNNLSVSAASSIYYSSKDFSGTQGGNNWSYQSYNGTTWSNLAYYDSTNKAWQPSSSSSVPQVSQFNIYPDSCSGCRIARVWTAPSTGTVSVRGRVLKLDLSGGDGIIARITKNGTRIWPASGDQTIAYNDDLGVESNLDSLSVTAGDVIRFEVEKNANNTSDSTSWTPAVVYVTPAGNFQASTGFSSTQGTNNWSYQSWNGSAYSDMTWDSVNSRWNVGGTLSIIGSSLQHPDGTDSVRKFTAPQSGTIRITGTVKKLDITGGDGVNVKIMKNGTQIWPASGWQYIAYNDGTGYSVNVSTSVAANDAIYFVVNKNGTNWNDSTSWDPLVSYVEGYQASLVYSLTQGANNWSYQSWNGSSYSNMTWDYANSRWNVNGTLSMVGYNWQHPDGTDSVRKFTVPHSGTIYITGPVYKTDITGGDGVNVKILKNSTQIWPASGWQFIAYNNGTGYNVNVSTSVAANDAIYFILNKNSTNLDDSTAWDPLISY